MLIIAIVSTKIRIRNNGLGLFFCPCCIRESRYVRRIIRNFTYFYFIPLFPRKIIGEFIECQLCKNTFPPEAVCHHNGTGNEEALFLRGIKRVMVSMMMADKVLDESEIDTTAATYREITGIELTADEIIEEINDLKNNDICLDEYLARLSPFLNESGRESIMEAAIMIAFADSDLVSEENDLLLVIMDSLGISRERFSQLINDL